MKTAITTLAQFVFVLATVFASTDAIPQVKGDTIELADPTIFPYDEKFYLYGTVEKSSRNGFQVYVSRDLKSWELSEKNDGYALKKGDAFGRSGFWAPQVFFHHGQFYMAYTANEQIAIAKSDSPLGPFTQTKKDSLSSTMKQIDPFVFIDDDGTKYLYHVRLTNGNRIFVSEMNDDLSGVKSETTKECVSGIERWENTQSVPWPVTEGPTVIKQDGIYYMFYSANDFRNPDYAVGYATSKHPLGPWTKYSGNPILVRDMFGINGTGHGDLFKVKRQWYYVFHTHHSNARTGPRKTALVKATSASQNNGRWKIVPSTFEILKTGN
ncbi:glycoside hydrolase family 43 protein [Pseudochryseolinea flava]|uniref:Beta-xylosidase n=1 Tax=Pseudochryseolinea flava TaxID=2059302 RepID=A0A364XW99_9BACT|nr:glycoside hydrolase family 43 protein [Pseudochryseolinea flava]RAV98231.1 beta-xylosidase [Pseudochryseolinea flava]